MPECVSDQLKPDRSMCRQFSQIAAVHEIRKAKC